MILWWRHSWRSTPNSSLSRALPSRHRLFILSSRDRFCTVILRRCFSIRSNESRLKSYSRVSRDTLRCFQSGIREKECSGSREEGVWKKKLARGLKLFLKICFSEKLLASCTSLDAYELSSIRSGIVEQFLRNIYNSNESFGYQLVRIKLFRVINYHYHLFYRCYSWSFLSCYYHSLNNKLFK